MRAPSEAANLQILLFRVGEKHWVRAFSVSLFPLIPLLSRPAVNNKMSCAARLPRRTSAPSEAANSFDQGFNIPADRFSRHDADATRFVICRCRDPLSLLFAKNNYRLVDDIAASLN